MSNLNEFRKTISVESGTKHVRPMREIVFRILTVPFFILGLCWYWVKNAFEKGYEWEAEEIERWWKV